MGNNLSLGDNQEVSYESGAGRLCKSIFVAICVAPLLILCMCGLLGWNERRAVCNDRAISSGQDTVQEIGCTDTYGVNNDLVMFSCAIDKASMTSRPLGGDFSGQTVVASGLETKAEMLQCIESSHSETKKKAGGGTQTITTYTYSVEWRSTYVNSHLFDSKGLSSSNWHNNCGYHNPAWPTGMPQSGTAYAPLMKVGQYNTHMASSVPVDTYVDTLSTPAGWSGSGSTFNSNKWVVGNGIGQARVAFYINDWNKNQATVLGEITDGDSGTPLIQAWMAPSSWLCSGFTLSKLEMGTRTKSELFADLSSENSSITWILRAVGFGLLWVAFCLCFGPLEVAADCIPCIGPCIGEGIEAIACCVSCLPATACCLGVAGVVWVAMRPMVGIPLMAFWCVVMVGFGVFIKKSRDKKGARDLERGSVDQASLQQTQQPLTQPGAMPQPYAQPGIMPQAQAMPQAAPVQRQQSVVVPAGCGPGSMIQVQTPVGMMQVQVPAGYEAGSQFAFAY